MRRNYSQTKKAVQSRDLRSRRYSERLFNVPLRKFTEHKYPSIYNEYVELFNVMRTLHPNRRKLETSSTFMEWMNAYPPVETQGEQTATSSVTTIPQYPCTDIITQALEGAFAEETPCENNNEDLSLDVDKLLQDVFGEETPRQNPCQDIEHLPPPVEQDPMENNEHLNEVDNILNEIMVKVVLYCLFNPPSNKRPLFCVETGCIAPLNDVEK